MAPSKVRAEQSEDTQVRIGVLGMGNVGAALVELIYRQHDAIAARSGIHIDIAKVAVRDLDKARSQTLPPGVLTDDSIDIIVELIGGLEPARSLVLQALAARKQVVTANKELLANFGSELFDASVRSGCALLFEGSVGGAIPLVRALRISLAGEQIRRVMGIVNGTTNYILSQMSEAKISYAAALAEAQSLGYAERDPTADVEGFDAAAKAAILAGIAFNADIALCDVYREGIDAIDVSDIDFAHRLGYEVKLLAIAERVDGLESKTKVAVRVHPAMLPVEHPLSAVKGVFNAVFVEGESCGELMLYGRGAGGEPTASALVGDLLDAASNIGSNGRDAHPFRVHVEIDPIDNLRAQYYVTVDVLDRPGVLASVATVFGMHGVSIRSMEQVGLSDEARLVFITHMAREADVQATLDGLRALDVVEHIGGLIRVIGPEL
jgi:homoserine dehydrogenase